MRNLKVLALILAFCGSSFGALPAGTVWEVRTAGSDSNGGGFVTGSSGTDFSQQNSAQYTFTDLASTGGTTNPCVVTSASHNFVAADVGNLMQITAGTNWTTGFYQIVSVASNAATLDRACGSVASISSGTYAVGGALLSVDKPFGAFVAGNIEWVKGGTYSISANLTTFSTACTSAATCQINGYTSSRGDNGQATIQASASITNMWTITGNYLRVRNLTIDANLKTTTTCINASTGTQLTFQNLVLTNWTVKGLTMGGNDQKLINSVVKNGQSGCTAGVNTQARDEIFGSRITGNACHGITTTVAGGLNAQRNLIDNNSGASTDGINLGIATGSTTLTTIAYNTIYNNGRWGINSSTASGMDSTFVYGNIIQANATGGINSTTTVITDAETDYNAFWNNGGDSGTTTTHNLTNWPQGAHDICAAAGPCPTGQLTGNPFTNAAGGDFSLNSTAGQGAVLRGAGYPGVVGGTGGTTTGHLDIGVAQAASVAAAGQKATIYVQ